MFYIIFLMFLFSAYFYRVKIIYQCLLIYNNYLEYKENNKSNKLTIDYVDTNNVYNVTNKHLYEFLDSNKSNCKYIILNYKNKKQIYETPDCIQKIKNAVIIDKTIICAIVSPIKEPLDPLQFDFQSELSKFLIDNTLIDLNKNKDLWISLINHNYNTHYNTSYELNWNIITDKIEEYNSNNIVISVKDGSTQITTK